MSFNREFDQRFQSCIAVTALLCLLLCSCIPLPRGLVPPEDEDITVPTITLRVLNLAGGLNFEAPDAIPMPVRHFRCIFVPDRVSPELPDGVSPQIQVRVADSGGLRIAQVQLFRGDFIGEIGDGVDIHPNDGNVRGRITRSEPATLDLEFPVRDGRSLDFAVADFSFRPLTAYPVYLNVYAQDVHGHEREFSDRIEFRGVGFECLGE